MKFSIQKMGAIFWILKGDKFMLLFFKQNVHDKYNRDNIFRKGKTYEFSKERGQEILNNLPGLVTIPQNSVSSTIQSKKKQPKQEIGSTTKKVKNILDGGNTNET